MNKFVFLVLSLAVVFAQCELNDQKLSLVLGELLDLRTELNELFQSPRKSYDNEEPDAEWVVHIGRGVAEAQWLANLTNTQLVGPMRGFPELYVFKSYAPHNKSESHRIRRDLSEHQVNAPLFWSELQLARLRPKRDLLTFNDPLWKSQWEVNGQSNYGSMRIAETWAEGYTGKGVVVSILDDGLDYKHKDLEHNYDPLASYDLNGNDNDPTPTMDEFNKHGTRCAGEIAMLANNSLCGVGVAYNAKIGGVRMLDGRVNDRLEAEALSLLVDHVDILSSSWGPTDDGRTVEGPGKLAAMGLQKGIREGRDGKGTIYVWASGNGGQVDDCSCDGYSSSIYTFTVSAASSAKTFPWYGEPCASTLASTFSSGTKSQEKIVTIDPQNQCTNDHTGTSASAPIAAGIIALTLEANPALTWREVQHLAVWSSNPTSLFHVSGWARNGAGLWSSYKFGFGLMDAYEMTKMAKNFQPLSPQQNCTTTFPNFKSRSITTEMGLVLSFKLNGCKGQSNEIKSLEHVQVFADIESNFRGLLSIWLESPGGMRSQLLHPRAKDNSTDGFKHWPFTSVQFWSEHPDGLWKLHIDQIKGASDKGTFQSELKNLTIVHYGTSSVPLHAKSPKQYRNMTSLPVSNSALPSNEESIIDITEMENIIRGARRSLSSTTKLTADSETHLLAVDRLVRRINKMNLQAERQRRFAHMHRAYEK